MAAGVLTDCVRGGRLEGIGSRGTLQSFKATGTVLYFILCRWLLVCACVGLSRSDSPHPESVSEMASSSNAGAKEWLSNQVSILLGFQSDEAVDYLLTFTDADELRSYISEFFGNGDAAQELASGLIQRMTFEVRFEYLRTLSAPYMQTCSPKHLLNLFLLLPSAKARSSCSEARAESS